MRGGKSAYRVTAVAGYSEVVCRAEVEHFYCVAVNVGQFHHLFTGGFSVSVVVGISGDYSRYSGHAGRAISVVVFVPGFTGISGVEIGGLMLGVALP